MNRTHRALVGAAIAATLLLGACSSDGGNDDASDDKASTEETTTTTEAAPEEDPQARAESVDLEIEDFGEDWTASAPETTEDSDGIVECAPELSMDEDLVLAEHDTDTFSTGDIDAADGTQFSASTRVYADEESASAVLEPFSDEEVITCIDESFKATVSQGGQLTVEGQMTDDDIDVGTDDAQGVSGEYTITGPDGVPIGFNVGLLAMRSGDVVTLVRILSVGDSLDPTTLADPLATLAERQGEA